ncbi:hypothetical protein BH09VER1_BH09VER1_44890 [soil metagenome]
MKATIRGMGWVTPLGRDLDEVFAFFEKGIVPDAETLKSPFENERGSVFRVSATTVEDAAAYPRLRRSSLISHFALAAATDAVARAGLSPEELTRTALVFASSDGGVIYTRRFYTDIAERGEGTGSPLLFPETVYNAPASHIAARLGLQGESVTLVGDATAGFHALQAGAEFLATEDADFCLVCAAQEIDWVTCEAYQRWRNMEKAIQTAPFSEGAAAIVLARTGHGCRIETSQEISKTETPPSLIVSSSSGTNLDKIEQESLCNLSTNIPSIAPKYVLGESFACSAVQQVIVGALALAPGRDAVSALISTVGFDRQFSALFLTESDR